ncbi:MAG: aminoacyl-tRNA hydrolase [Legionella sp.]|nr:aminoacyl-tRNA hydrolase [Legionella sp.]
MAIKLIVGLRNPGENYAKTRHNAGAWFVERLAMRYRASFKAQQKMQGELSQFSIENQMVRALLPLTFMNHSGYAVKDVMQFYKFQSHEILVAHDDMDLEAGRIKIKTGGGNAGHNGLRSISAQLGNAEFHRLRIGIGHPGHKDRVLSYVLGVPPLDDYQQIMTAIDRSVDIMPTILQGDIAAAMNLINSAQ